jgi:hypothetical protein
MSGIDEARHPIVCADLLGLMVLPAMVLLATVLLEICLLAVAHDRPMVVVEDIAHPDTGVHEVQEALNTPLQGAQWVVTDAREVRATGPRVPFLRKSTVFFSVYLIRFVIGNRSIDLDPLDRPWTDEHPLELSKSIAVL